MVVPGPLGWESLPPPPRRSKTLVRLLAVLVVALLLLAGAGVTLPYFALAPGSARQVNDLIRVPEAKAFPPRGKVFLATVSLRQVTPFGALQGWLDRDVDVVPERAILGSTPRRQFTQQNVQLMDDSKQVAVVVALRRLGFAVPEEGKGALVENVEKGSPADGRLAQGEVITAVDGVPTPLSDRAVEGLRRHRPGEAVRLDVLGVNGAPRSQTVVLTTRPQGEGGFLGVFLRTKEQHFAYPFDVTIDSGAIGGSSAGLAFTLGVLDTLTRGELTGGKKVAVTGTIELDGTIGDVGGVAQKTAAVRAAGAQYFLVPPGEFKEAVAHAGGGLHVMKVANLDQALSVLARFGGDVSALGPGRRGSQG
jgi:PDZ domain-containing protein